MHVTVLLTVLLTAKALAATKPPSISTPTRRDVGLEALDVQDQDSRQHVEAVLNARRAGVALLAHQLDLGHGHEPECNGWRHPHFTHVCTQV